MASKSKWVTTKLVFGNRFRRIGHRREFSRKLIFASVTNSPSCVNVYRLITSWTLTMALCLLSCTSSQPPARPQASTAKKQTSPVSATDMSRILKLRGILRDHKGNQLTGVVGVLFAIYEQENGGAPLWQEVQNVRADDRGRFLALVGTTKSDGIDSEIFNAQTTCWLGMRMLLPGEIEQPRMRVVNSPEGLIAERTTELVFPQPSNDPQGTPDAQSSAGETSAQDSSQPPPPKRSLGDRRRMRSHPTS